MAVCPQKPAGLFPFEKRVFSKLCEGLEILPDLQRQRIEQARADQRHYWAMEERQKKLTTEQWMGQGVMAWGDKPPTKANMDSAGVPVWLQPAFAQSVNSFNKSMMEGQRLAPASQAGLTAVQILSSTGQLTQDEVLALSTIYGADKAKEWYATN